MEYGSKNHFSNVNDDQNDMVGDVLAFGANEFYNPKKEKHLQREQIASRKSRPINDENLINVPASEFYTAGKAPDMFKQRPHLSSRSNNNSNHHHKNISSSMMMDGSESFDVIATIDNVVHASRGLRAGEIASSKSMPAMRHIADKENKVLSESSEWQENQAKLYSDWMNFMFSKMYSIVSVDGSSPVESGGGNVDAAINNHIHDALVLKEYGFISQNAKFMLKAQCDIGIFRMLDRECNCGNIQMKDDRDITVDVGLQADLMELLFSYELPWLKLGLEIVSNKPITIKKNGEVVYTIAYGQNSDMWKKSMKVHVLKNILYDEGIASQFEVMRAQTIKTEKIIKDAFRKHALKMLLSLIFLLDKFREAELLKLPSLFQKDSGIKSSTDMMLAFCKNFMKGEGDFSKHLNELGFIVGFKQEFSDEFDYRISNIKTDLKDGVRLAKLLEMLNRSQYSNISRDLRVPAISRLQKIHNLEKVIGAVIPSDSAKVNKLAGLIVEGNMTATFSFLWEVFFRHEASSLIDDSSIYKEIKAIRANMEWRRSVYGEVEAQNFAVKVPTRMLSTGNIDYPPIVSNARMETELDADVHVTFNDQGHISSSLQDWCHSISSQYGISVENFETSLSDGRVLCLMIHYYHPKVLPLKNIHKPTNRTAATRGLGEGISVFVSAEKKNFAVLKKACKSIGGIPWMLEEVEKGAKVEEKSMILFLSYLFNRLIESSNNVRAAIRLQRWFRSFSPDTVAVVDAMSISNEGAAASSARAVISMAENPDITIFVPSGGRPHHYSVLKIQRCWKKHAFRCRLAHAFEQMRMERLRELLEIPRENGNFDNSNSISHSHNVESDFQMDETSLAQYEVEIEVESSSSGNCRRSSRGGKRRSSCVDEDRLPTHSFSSEMSSMSSNASSSMMEMSSIDKEEIRRELENEIRTQYEQQRKQELESQRKLTEMRTNEIQQMFQSEIMKGKMETEMAQKTVENLESEMSNIASETMILSSKLSEENERLQIEREGRLAAEAMASDAQLQLQQLLESIEREKQMKKAAMKSEEARKQAAKQQKRIAATAIQKIWRCFSVCKMFKKVQRGVLVFQSNYRGYRVREGIRKQQRESQKRAWERSERIRLANIEAMERNRLASIEEANRIRKQRDISAANTIKKGWKCFLISLRVHKLVGGFKRLQAAFRARKVVRNCSPKVLQTRLKIKMLDVIARKDTKLRLGHRTSHALQMLKEGKMISQYLKACQILEFSTRHSRRCCEAFAQANASQILFGIVRSCNRSTPHDELLRNVMVVLLNVARWSHLAKTVGQLDECSEILVDRMQMSRDKKELFCLSTELLCRLVHANPAQKAICNGFRSRIETILSILERKHRLDCKLKGIAPLASQFTSPMKGDRRGTSRSLDQLNLLSKMEPIEALQDLMKLLS